MEKTRSYTARTENELKFDFTDFDTLHEDEWDEKSIGRLDEPMWDKRYDYEARLITEAILYKHNIKTVLELGSGPGILSQKIQKDNPNLTYHLVDKEYAKKYFDDNNFEGEMFVKDLSTGFDTSGLLDNYDLIITNDFLEHVLNPSGIARATYDITHKDSKWLVSNPNWRMGHQYVYRGLFDFDNLVYFMHVHGFSIMDCFASSLKIAPLEQIKKAAPKLASESQLPDSMLDSWNHYMLFKRREIEKYGTRN